MTTIMYFDFSTASEKDDFSFSASGDFSGELQLLRSFIKYTDLEWSFNFDQATPEEIYFWTEADLIVRAERAFLQGKMVFLEGHVISHDDFCRSLAIFRGTFGSLPDVLEDDFESIIFGSPVTDMEKHYQFVGRLLGAPV